ncbi:tetratricopeptide repeat protein [Rudaea cellulosilytica]|uniref:tetratricopeptide repeat protein n=1 Tax=Rudaea cellulosilytica TaxID=540746 RepID=UPI0003636E9C|nr:tetratricopeptide repeat protein [Rudaea cellulosilytica]
MSGRPSFLAELRRRNVIRAGLLYIGAVWALAQGVAQLGPPLGAPEWITRWFVIAAGIGFPFWLAFAWFYEWTPQGLKRESEVAAEVSITHSTARKMDFWIIGVLGLAVVLLLTDRLIPHRSDGAAISDKSIAVLPLTNDSGDKDQQYFSDGLSDDLINALMQFGNLKVIGRNSAFQFRDSKEGSAAIGLKLGVAYLLTGSVRKLGDTVRINAQLVKAADGSGVWSQSYDRPYIDLFKLQDEITEAVAGALKAKLLQNGDVAMQSERPPNGNLAAYNAYQQGRFYTARNNEPDLRTAIAHFHDAVRLDPGYAAAYAWLGNAQATLAGNYLAGADTASTYAQAQSAIDTALRLNPMLPQAHMTQARLMMNRNFDWRGAQVEQRRALELAPNDPRILVAYAWGSAILGQVRAAIDLTEQALKLDPLQSGARQNLALLLAVNGRLDEAKAAVDKAVELQPSSDTHRVIQAYIATFRGDFPAALAIAQSLSQGMWRDVALALVLQIGPDRAAADAALQNLIDKHIDSSAYQIAEIYALRRDPDNAFKWLDRAWDARDGGIVFLLNDALLLRYRHDPRYAAFALKVGLPTTTDAKGLP